MNTRSQTRKKKNRDKLSELPDCVLLHILSFLRTTTAVQSCILSTRWKHLWKHLTTLTFCSSYFKHLKSFTGFVSQVLSLRDASTPLHVLDFKRKGILEPHVLNRILKYALSHNVQQLQINIESYVEHFPPCFGSCQTLTSLNLSVGHTNGRWGTLYPNYLNFPALTNLSLHHFTFCGSDEDGSFEPFSKFKRLNSLIIDHCKLLDAQKLCISSPTLVNLTIKSSYYTRHEIELSNTPSLSTFDFEGTPVHKLSRSNTNLSSIKHVNIHVDMWLILNDTPLVLLNWLVELSNIESLTVSLTTLQVLSNVPDLLKLEFSSLYNLKSFKVKAHKHNPPILSDEIVNFLLQNAPSAERTISYIN
ncbi:F-box protein At4g22280-like [Vicia villosa]|uniref:F-box protein At4g22280-like n=1 Tax=Vicia villosa TaxID=3911 RepID=UPI00273B09EA|nr:F-box protein At4g22280-like [Vicia villosa]